MGAGQDRSRNRWADAALSGLLDEGADDMCDEAGPPTEEDSAWFQHHVVSKGYPRLKREPKQMAGQERLLLTNPALEDTAAYQEAHCPDFWTWPVFHFTDEGPERLS